MPDPVSDPRLRSRLRRMLRAYAWSFAVWTAFWSLMLLLSLPAARDLRARGLNVTALQWGAYDLVYYYQWALITPVLVYVCLRFPLDRNTWLRGVPVLLLVTVVAAAVFVAPRTLVAILASRQLGFPPRPPPTDLSALLPVFSDNVYMVVQILVAGQAIAYCHAFRERERRAAELTAQLARTQLEALRTQLRPHFLFNTLHAISTLMQRDVAGSRRMLALLADLLRRSLDSSGTATVPLAEEQDFLERYLEIERTRFGARMSTQVEIAHDVRDAAVPIFLLQPLAENAVRHGVARRAGPGRVVVRAGRDGEDVRLEVRDSGPGLAAEPRDGVGLGNTRARLQQLYGHRQQLELANAPGGGCIVTVRLPYQPVPDRGTGGDPAITPEALPTP